MSFKSGFVTVLGKPNVGKSSLINKIVGEKVSIVSPKPQTTRNNILGILNQPELQIVFTDTPGIHSANNKLDSFMQKSVNSAKAGSDVILVVLDGTKIITESDITFIKSLQSSCENIIVVVNKTDATTYDKLYPQLNKLNGLDFVREIIPTSALKGTNIDVLLNAIKRFIPQGEQFYDQDIYTDKTLKFMVAEIIREKALWLLQNEIPHGIGVDIVKFEEGNIVNIDADIVCEKQTHKQIIIGKGGQTLKNIGTKARVDIEKLLNQKVFLNLFVKVRKNWRDNSYYVNDLGYNDKFE